jgi:hypothetical protein
MGITIVQFCLDGEEKKKEDNKNMQICRGIILPNGPVRFWSECTERGEFLK